MRVLLTGGAGYIGAHTAVELQNAGHTVVSVDNYANSSPEALKRVERITGQAVAAYQADICDKKLFRRVFEQERIDAVIHFAALKAVGESVMKPLEYYRNNLDGSMCLMELMSEFSIKRLVFSSSATVYGDTDEVSYVEEMTTGVRVSSPYGWTKCMIEQMIRDYAVVDEGFSAVLLRYFNPVGAHDSYLIGEDPRGVPNNVMPRILRVAAGEVAEFGIYGTDYPTKDGTCVRDYIHVVDIAKGHVAALEYMDSIRGAEPINLGCGKGYSVRELLDTFEQVTGAKIPVVVEPRRPGDLPMYYANPEKAERLLRWKAEKTLEQMCRDAWSWKKSNPNGYQ